MRAAATPRARLAHFPGWAWRDAGLEGCESGCRFCWSPFAKGGLVFSTILFACLGMPCATPPCQGWTGCTPITLRFALDCLVWVYPPPDGSSLGQGQNPRHLWVPCTWHTPWHRVGAKVTSSHATRHAVQRLAWLVYCQDEGPLPSWEAWWQPCFCSARPGLSPLFL